jgi:hypothetical protein
MNKSMRSDKFFPRVTRTLIASVRSQVMKYRTKVSE